MKDALWSVFGEMMKNKSPKLDVKIEKIKKPDQLSKIKNDLFNCLGEYFFKSERSDKMPNDPVARFHLGNGATLEQIYFLGVSILTTAHSLNM